MNALRAPAFTTESRRRLQLDPGWLRLPPGWVLDRVVGVAIDSRGFVYLAHRGEHPVLCFRPDGTFSHEIGSGHHRATTAYDLRGPVPIPIATRCWMHGLHIDPWDNVWITDVGRHLIMKFTREGALALTLGVDGESGCDQRRFGQPTHVCVVPSGDLFITDGYGNSRIVHCRADGTYLREWGARGTAPGEFHTPHVITADASGLLYMTDRENDRIQVFDQTGRVVDVWPDLHSVDGLTVAPDGYLYGSAGIDNAILRLDRKGRVLDVWALPGILHYPHAVAVNANGDIFTAETGDNWVVTGRLPEQRTCAPREGPEGSALQRFRIVD
ncbi:MAG: peptidyl-alpha-hydroxyglycine alpha-amidating lyase family protein [Opitutaceae bacterium]